MPIDDWREMIGVHCGMCGGPATHWYVYPQALCCSCHTGEKDGGIYTDEQAALIHEGLDPIPSPEHGPPPGVFEDLSPF